LKTVGRVVEACSVAKKRIRANRDIVTACGVAKERIKTDCRVIGSSGKAEKRIVTQGSVVVGQAAFLASRSRLRRKRKAGESEQCKRGINNIRYCFHAFISFHLLCERASRSRFTLREEGQVELLGRRPTDLARGQSCPSPTDNVNTICYEAEHFTVLSQSCQI